MELVRNFIKWFLYITISIFLVVTLTYKMYSVDTIPTDTLINILISGFLTTAVTVVIALRECKSKWTALLKYILHYIALCVVMCLCADWFGWYDLNLSGILSMSLSVAIVYAMSFGVYCLIDWKQAKDINKMLKEKYKDEE